MYIAAKLDTVSYDTIDNEKSMPSIKHSLVQTNIAGMLFNDTRFTTFVELSLDAATIDLAQFGLKTKDELVPDICVYLISPPIDDRPGYDSIKVSCYPDLVIEILSPTQAIGELLKKIEAYFALGVKSCWLAIPAFKEIKVFSQLNQYETFNLNNGEIVDKTLDIRLPMERLFFKSSSQLQPVASTETLPSVKQ